MRITLLVKLTICSLLPAVTMAQTSPNRVPYSIYDNFDTGEMYAWEPYPYQQDTGYDPAFSTKREPAYGGKGSSLFRVTKPNDANDLSQGFTKRIDMYTSATTRVKFAVYLMSDRKPEKIDVSLGSFDGTLYTHTIKNPKANGWVEIDLPRSAFTNSGKAVAIGDHLQVVVVKASYPVVSHLLTYTILLDEVSITGERPRQFVGELPKSTWLEHFGKSILHKHFAPGETVSLSVSPEDKIGLSGASVDLMTPSGIVQVKNVKLYDDGSHGDVKALDGKWSNNQIYKIKPSDPKGQWSARLAGTGESRFSWDLHFIVPANRLTADNHPRVWFNGQDLKARMAGDEPAPAKKLLENFVKSYRPSTLDLAKVSVPSAVAPESVTGGPYASASMGGWYATQDALARVITSEAWQFYLAGDQDAGGKAKAALLKLSSLPSWNHPWMEANGNHTYYPGAPAAMAAGLGYDLLYTLLTEQERAVIRKGIMDNAIKPFYRDMVELNRMPSSNSNHIGVILSGVGVAAVAIAGDDPAMPGMEPYMSGILAKSKQFMDRTLLPEGSYNEPYTYQEFGYREFVEALYAYERNLGVDYTSTTYLKEFYHYPLYVTQNNRGKYQDLGDTSPTYSFIQQPSQWLVYKMKDPFMYNYVKPAWEAGTARGGILPYLWYTEGISAKRREILPLAKHFEGKGHFVSRSSWDDSGNILIYKAGPNGNHYHLDQGTILLTHNGEELLSDAGHSSSYYANLYYPGYYTQAIGHNVMLVDMNAESQSTGDFNNGIAALRHYPEITNAFAGNIIDAVESDLTKVYKEKVSTYKRTLVSTKSGPIFLFDQVKSPDEHTYNWLFHAEHTNGKSSLAYADNRMTITRTNARLTMDVLSPSIVSNRIRNSDRDESFIALNSANTRDVNFLAVMTPEAKPSSGEFLQRSKASRVEEKGWLGAVINDNNITYYGFFRTGDNAADLIQGFNTDASKFTAALTEGKVSKIYFEGTRYTGYGTQINFSVPIAAAMMYTSAGADIEVKSNAPGKMTVSSKAVSTIRVNGVSLKKWNYDPKSGMLTISFPAGKSVISMR